MNHPSYKNSIFSMPLGYALHKVIVDDKGCPCDWEFIEANPAFEALTGLKSANIAGRRATEVLPDIKNQSFNWIGACGAVALGGAPLETEHYAPLQGKWYRVNIYCPEENLFATVITDITEQKNACSAYADSEKKLKTYLDEAPVGIAIVNGKGKLQEANAQAVLISGYDREELKSRSLQRFVAPGSRIFALMFFKELIINGEAESQLQLTTGNGGSCWLSVQGRQQSEDRYVLYCQDITSYKEMEDDLVESELLYRTFIDASDDIIYLKDEHLRYKIVNNTLLDQFECEYTEIIGKTDAEALPEAFASQAGESDAAAIKTNTSSVTDMTVDGRVYEAIKFPVSIGKGKTGVGAYIRDITEEKKQEAILKRTMERHRILANTLLMTFQSGHEQLDYALREALSLTGSQFGFIFSFDETDATLSLNHWTSGVLDEGCIHGGQPVYTLEQAGLWGDVVRTRSAKIVNDFTKAKLLKDSTPSGNVRIRKLLSIPVILGDKVVAAVGLANKPTDYDDFDVDELTMLMNGIWIAVEKKIVQNKMENLLEQTQAMFNEHDAVMLLTDPATGRIIDANPAAITFYGYTREELLDLSLGDINIQPNEMPDADLFKPEKKHRFFSAPHRLKNGEKRIVDVYSCPITYNSDKVLFSIIFDVTEREEAFDEIKYLSFHDHLTGLYNRRYFDSVLKLMNDEKYMPLTIVMADVNGLKLVNDSFGHAEGDELLIKAAEIISEGCRRDDISARIGGDEFVIILPKTDSTEAGKIVRRIKKMQSKIRVHQLDLSMSFGYAVKYDVASDIELVVSEAENSMYKNKAHESASTRNKTVNIIMKTLYEKCIGELAHSNRVSKIAAAIATEMNLSPEQINQVGIAGLLHDIGKIGVDDAVLNKTGLFTKSDREEIERHSESGWRILSNSDEYSGLAEYILYHHENIDGKGYPRGMKGEAIPLESKIIAVSDSYDAMTNDRPYRKAMSKSEAIEELRRFSGSQFDPEVVDVFIQKVLSAEAYADI
jgi:diguanylate cyclase (GGDEF)-like protein/PAS domain S-box-containing protein